MSSTFLKQLFGALVGFLSVCHAGGDAATEDAGADTDTDDDDGADDGNVFGNDAGEDSFDTDLDTDDDDEGDDEADTAEIERGEEDEGEDQGDDDEGEDSEEEEDPGEDDDLEDEEGEDEGEEGEAERPVDSQMLEELWESRLDRAVREDPDLQPPRLNMSLESVQLSEDGRKRFVAALAKEGVSDEDAQAGAIFEIAVDAVMQTLGQYHNAAVAPTQAQFHDLGLAMSTEAKMAAFTQTPEGQTYAKSPKVQAAMAAKWEAVAKKHGKKAANMVPYEDYFRMAGGKAAAKRVKSEKTEPAEKAKRRALAKSTAPRGGRRTSGRGARQRVKSDEQETFEHIQRTGSPFFSLE